MTWLEFTVEIISELVWPVIVLVFIIVFRKEIKELLARIQTIKGQGAKIDFDDLDNAQESSNDLPVTKTDASLLAKADTAPLQAIQEAWAQIEAAIKESCDKAGIKPGRGKPNHSLRLKALVDAKRVDASVIEPFEWLKEFVIESKSGDNNIPEARVKQFIELAASVRAAIETD